MSITRQFTGHRLILRQANLAHLVMYINRPQCSSHSCGREGRVAGGHNSHEDTAESGPEEHPQCLMPAGHRFRKGAPCSPNPQVANQQSFPVPPPVCLVMCTIYTSERMLLEFRYPSKFCTTEQKRYGQHNQNNQGQR